MKAIILAAGQGTRLQKYTNKLPKGMLHFDGKTLIERQINNFRNAGIDDITIVTGYMADKINYEGIKTILNTNFNSTNMVESLFCAKKELNDEVVVSYADIIYEKNVLDGLINALGDIVLTIDKNWKTYWMIRYGSVSYDLESLALNNNGTIKELGGEVADADQIDARYVGLIKFTKKGISTLKEVYHKNKILYWDVPWQVSGKTFQNAYMTDIIQEVIDNGIAVNSFAINNGWLEFDSNEDYEKMTELLKEKKLKKIIYLK